MRADSVQIPLFQNTDSDFFAWLSDAASELHAAATLERCLDLVLRHLETLVDYDGASIAFLDDGQLVAAATRTCFRARPTSEPSRCSLAAHPCRSQLLGSAQVILGKGPVDDGSWLCLPGAKGAQSWLLCPLFAGKRLIGQLALCKYEPGVYTAEAAAQVEALAKHAAIALHNVDSAQRVSQRARQLQAQIRDLHVLLETLRELSADLALDNLYQRAAEKAIEIIPGIDVTLVFALEGSAFVCRGTAGVASDACQGMVIPAISLLGEWATMLDSEDGPSPWRGPLPQGVLDALRARGDTTWEQIDPTVLFPMQVTDELLGLVVLGRSEQARPFEDETLETARLFVAQTSISIANARLYQIVREYATTLESRVDERTREMREAKERTEAILRSVADGVVVTDLDGQIVEANPVALTWLQACHQGSVYHNARLRTFVRELVLRPEQPGPAVVEFPAEMLSGDPCIEEIKCRERACAFYGLDAGPCWAQSLSPGDVDAAAPDSRNCSACPRYAVLPKTSLQAHAAPIAQGDSLPIGTVIVLRDISRLTELDRLKSQFVSNVSHELRTPLSNIKLYLSLLGRGRVEKHAHYLQILEDETARLSRLIEALLDLSRLEAGQNRAAHESQRWQEVAQQVLEMWRPQLENKGLELYEDWNETGAGIRADRNQMIQVFSNLLSNAINYTSPGGWIRIEARDEARDGQAWSVLAVRDSGIGIPEADLAHVFDRFFRGRAEGLGIPGNGLGLTIVREIVEMYGGHIELESQEGVGSSFVVYMPRVSSNESTP